MKKLIIVLFSLSLLSGCSLLLSEDDPKFSREKYDEFYKMGNYEGALIRVNQRLEKYPQDAFLHNEKAFILIETEEYEEALDSLNIAMDLSDKRVADSVYNNRATALNELGRYEEALDDAKKSIDLKPDEPEAYLNMGNAFSYLDRYEEALTYYDLALDRNPNEANALYGRGVTYYALMEYEEAERAFQQYLSIEEDPDAYWFLVDIHYELGEYDEAIPFLDKLIEFDSEDEFDILDYKGLLLANSGDMEASLDIYEALVEHYPREAFSYYGKGTALINLNEIDQGLKELQAAIQLDPEIADYAMEDPLLGKVTDNDAFWKMLQIQ